MLLWLMNMDLAGSAGDAPVSTMAPGYCYRYGYGHYVWAALAGLLSGVWR